MSLLLALVGPPPAVAVWLTGQRGAQAATPEPAYGTRAFSPPAVAAAPPAPTWIPKQAAPTGHEQPARVASISSAPPPQAPAAQPVWFPRAALAAPAAPIALTGAVAGPSTPPVPATPVWFPRAAVVAPIAPVLTPAPTTTGPPWIVVTPAPTPSDHAGGGGVGTVRRRVSGKLAVSITETEQVVDDWEVILLAAAAAEFFNQ